MKLLYLLALGCALGRPTAASAQVANGDFETQLHAPEGRSNIASLSQASSYNDLANWYSLSNGDYLATNATDPQLNPQGTPYYGPFPPNSGNGCVALTREPYSHLSDQFVTQQVRLIAGHTYRASFAKLRRPGGQYAEKMALTVTSSVPSYRYQLSPAAYATIVSGPISDSQNWTTVSGTFVAQGSTAWITVGYDYSLASQDPSLYTVQPGGGDYYAVDDVVLTDLCQSSSTPYPTGTYRVNYGPATTLYSTNFVQRNMNALNIVVNLNQPYNFVFDYRDPSVSHSSTATSTSFTIPANSSNDVFIDITATNGPFPCGTAGSFVFSPTGYGAPGGRSYAASPNPASSELRVSDATADAAAPPTEPSAEPFTAELYDARGKKVKLQKSARGQAVLDTRDLPDGLYHLRVGTGKNIHSEQIQIKH